MTDNLLYVGLKSSEFPSDLSGQNAKATEMIKEMMKRVLGREEAFKVAVRRGANVLRKARDSTMFLLPPIEVRFEPGLYISDEKTLA
jgi:hypothetical protein